jgi:putative GTP pyrophosphokinase
MNFAKPEHSRNEVDRAGRVLANPLSSEADLEHATHVLANWRASHMYLMNNFQITLRRRAGLVGDRKPTIAQRLKRAPTIAAKLRRFPKMNLSQMQDIGGLRAVVSTVEAVRHLEAAYKTPGQSRHRFKSAADYISEPKDDGYRGVHIIFRYHNETESSYNGLQLELQLRTRLQHYWATAVETMGTFLGQALKSGQGDAEWLKYFAVAGACFAHMENTPTPKAFETMTKLETYKQLTDMTRRLKVLSRLHGFAIAADKIGKAAGMGKYNLVVLDSARRTVAIQRFPETKLDEANEAYAAVEQRALAGEQVEAVLVSTGHINNLRFAYPNYYLDTSQFARQIMDIVKITTGNPSIVA